VKAEIISQLLTNIHWKEYFVNYFGKID